MISCGGYERHDLRIYDLGAGLERRCSAVREVVGLGTLLHILPGYYVFAKYPQT